MFTNEFSMHMKNSVIAFLIIILVSIVKINGQTITIKGSVADSINHTPLIGATVQLNVVNGQGIYGAVTDTEGSFNIKGIRSSKDYSLIVSYIGYNSYKKTIKAENQNLDLHEITLSESVNKIGEVKVVGEAPRATQIQDTLQLNADAYKVNPDANAEDLVKKMPGITVENGQVQAQGENVQKVYVDGKPFFDQDPTLTLRNLPAEIVDKIQIFDEQSDQSKFTGFNDGQTSKTINVITRSNMRNGQFGKVYAGYGNDNKYYAGGNINIFKGNSRLSIIGLSNNINQQNFSSQDLLGVVGGNQRRGGGGFRGGPSGGGRNFRPGGGVSGGNTSFRGGGEIGNFLIGQQPGIATTQALGLNYSDKWGKKINITGSYFVNYTKNETEQTSNQNYFSTAENYNETDNSIIKNLNHRINFRFDYAIDSLNSLMIRPSISIQQNNSNSFTLGQSFENDTLITQSQNKNSSDLTALNFSNDLLFMHRFMKPGRTISIDISTGINTRDGISDKYAENGYNLTSIPHYDSLDQQTELPTEGYSVSSRIAYTEPIGKYSQLEINYRTSMSWNNSDHETFDFNSNENQYSSLDTLLSNTFKSFYIAHQIGPGYRYRKNNLLFVVGVNYEYATLTNNQKFPIQTELHHYFNSIQPNAMLRFNISQNKNLRLFYRTSTNAPTIDQLQNVLDNSNSLQLSSGNPDLKQAYQQNLFLRYSSTNASKTSVFFSMIGFSTVSNYIANSNFLANSDTILNGDISLNKGVQYSSPVNMNGYWNFRFFTTFGFPFKPLKSNLNFNTSYLFTKTPGLVNGDNSISNNNAFGLGIVLSSNISSLVDFNLSSNSNYNIAQNSLQNDQNNNYFSQYTNFTLNLIFLKSLTFQSNIGQQFYHGLSQNYNANYVLWNLSIGKKMFKNKRGELKLSVFDVLNQNSNVSRNVTEFYIEDIKSNVLQRYAILTFTYNLRNFRMNAGEEPTEERRPPPSGEPLFRHF